MGGGGGVAGPGAYIYIYSRTKSYMCHAAVCPLLENCVEYIV